MLEESVEEVRGAPVLEKIGAVRSHTQALPVLPC